jgi:triosephosphate isomerase
MRARSPLIVQSNWKMHKTHDEALAWIAALGAAAPAFGGRLELIVCAPHVHLRALARAAAPFDAVAVGAQNVHAEERGAFTGEVSAPMLADAGARYCVVGHSERRSYFGETDEAVNRKVQALLRHGVRPIVCIGEDGPDRDRGLTLNRLERQIRICFEGLTASAMRRVVVEYEPIWAIGTGRNATPEQAAEAHGFIRQNLAGRFDPQTAAAVRIFYGGSVKPHNAAALLAAPDIDGVGVGSASLAIDDFLAIARACAEASGAAAAVT